MKEFEVLSGCGFTIYESKILVALHTRGASTVSDVGKSTGVPKNKVYEILDKLRTQQIVQLGPTKPKKYGVVSLKSVLAARLEAQRTKLQEIEKNIDDALAPTSHHKPYEQTFWVMEGRSAMLNNVLEALQTVKEESIGFIDVWAARPINFRAVKDAIGRGVKFYFLGSINKETMPIAREYAKLGVHIRHLPITGAGYSIFDTVKVQLRATDNKIIILTVESAQFASILREHFFQMWAKAKEVDLN